MRIAIIGAGPAGLTAGYVLSKKNIYVDIFEATEDVGGMSRTLNLWDQKVDLGPHRFFSLDEQVNKLWFEIIGEDYQIISRKTRIFSDDKYFDYPLKPFDALPKLGIIESVKCLISYFFEQFKFNKKLDTFADWTTSKFGKRLYERFFKKYSEKLWGVKCEKIDSDFAAQRIKNFSLLSAIKNMFFKKYGEKHKTLVDEFFYPQKGSGVLYKNMAKYIESKNGKIYFNSSVKKLINLNSSNIGLEFENETKYYNHVISSMPLTTLVKNIEKLPNDVNESIKKLKYRNTVLVYLLVEGDELFHDQWIYIHQENLKVGRITNFRNWSTCLYGKEKNSILCLEYWCNYGDEFWNKSKIELIKIAKKEIHQTKLINNEAILDSYVYKINKSYPVYNTNYQKHIKIIKKYLQAFSNLQLIGRYGAFKYNNQDHSIMMGVKAAENILNNRNIDLFDINTNYDVYQESGKLKKKVILDEV